jgi:cytidylate kinase-like protein
MGGVVTISAAFGAGGSEIGPAVATVLGLPFFDRAIPMSVAGRLGIPVEDAQEHDERVDTGWWRILSTMSFVPDAAGIGPYGRGAVPDERAFQLQTEKVLHEVADGGGVLLGRAGAIVLADVADALHVRLTGPAEARIAGHARRTGLQLKDAEKDVRTNDAAREHYVKQLYHCDATECRHYHLVIDSTALPWETVTELIVTAARAVIPHG